MYTKRNKEKQPNVLSLLTMVFADIGSMKLFKISANVFALTLALPTLVGSCFIHFSQLSHTASIAGTLVVLSHRFSLNSRAQTAISANVSDATSRDLRSTSERIVDQKL